MNRTALYEIQRALGAKMVLFAGWEMPLSYSGVSDVLADKLLKCYQEDDWRWFEPTLTYDNAIIPLALFRAFSVTGERKRHGKFVLSFPLQG